MSKIPLALGGTFLIAGAYSCARSNADGSRMIREQQPCGRLQVRSRQENVAQLRRYSNVEQPMDLMIIGGGSVGCGVSLDASLRGLSVGLVEKNDYASGTSSRSTKLIHGGIRYLEKAITKCDISQLKVVTEALRERRILIQQAPHLCQALPLIVPCYDVFDLIKYYVGLKMYDTIAFFGGGSLNWSRFLSPYETLRIYPRLRTTSSTNSALLGSVEYYDGQMDDARLCLAIALTASAFGAAVTNYTEAKSIELVKNRNGESVSEITVDDKVSGEQFRVYAKVVVNASGPYAAAVKDLCTNKEEEQRPSQSRMTPSRGTHVVLKRDYCPRTHEGMVIPSSDNRVIFAIPWYYGCLLGTTDVPVHGPVPADPQPTQEEVDFLLSNAMNYIGRISKDAVVSSWAGIRPLAASSGSGTCDTQSISREHAISVDMGNRMVHVTGGKWTTYRKIAEETVDVVVKRLLPSDGNVKPCETERVVLLGGGEVSLPVASEVKETPIPSDIFDHWKSTYGDRCEDMLELVSPDKVKQSEMEYTRLREGTPITEIEVAWASRYEHCERVSDFLCRRTRLAFINIDAAKDCVRKVADLMSKEKGWSTKKKETEIILAFKELESFTV